MGPWRAGRLVGIAGLSSISLRDIPVPELPGADWLGVRPVLSGICGSDLSAICAKGSPYFSPLTSTPFVPGHEVVGVVEEVGDGVSRWESSRGRGSIGVGDRVVLEPALGCEVRGIEPMCEACRAGRIGLCRCVTRGAISAGIQTGYCRDTGGGWSERFVAHRSQLYAVPDGLSDEAAVLAEPLACALHGVGRVWPIAADAVCVMGCGSVGLLTIAALRGRGFGGRVLAIAKYDHQVRFAKRLGADEVLPAGVRGNAMGVYGRWADAMNAELYRPEMGRPTVLGGMDVMFDCIGSSRSIDDAIRFTSGGGDMVLVGMPGIAAGVDWTAMWYKEVRVHASYAYGLERCGLRVDEDSLKDDRDRKVSSNENSAIESSGTKGLGKEGAGKRDAGGQGGGRRHTIEAAIEELVRNGDVLADLVHQPFGLEDYGRAIATAFNTGREGAIKCAFRIRS